MGGISSSKQGGVPASWLSALADSGRGGDVRPGNVINLYRLVLNSCPALRAVMGPGVQVQVTAPEDLGRVRGHAGQLRQALLSLAVNAADAMVGQGTLRIFLTNQDPEPGPGTGELRAQNAPTGHVLLEIADHGCGMDPAVMERIFDPSYTTKEDGNGLGLFLVRDVARRHGGSVSVESAPEVGTTVMVYLPRGG